MSKNNVIDLFQSIRLGEEIDRQVLLENINVVDEEGGNLLHEAIAYSNIPAAETLITLGINVDKANNDGLTPLHYAAQYKNYEAAKSIVLLSKNINPIDKHGNSPLWTAVFNARGDYRMVDLFVRSGMNPNTKNLYGKSSLDFASQINEKELISILIDNAPGINNILY